MVDLPHKTDKEWLEEVRAAHEGRAAFYYAMFCELRDEFDEETALKIIGKTCHKLGLKKSKTYKPRLADDSAETFCTYFCYHGSVNNKIFEMEAKQIISDGQDPVAYLCRCPLVEGWEKQGVSPQDIEKLCKAAREFDYGTLEGLGLAGHFETLISKGDECCTLIVK